MSTILVLHGPNLNLLGEREPSQYGNITLERINQQLIQQATAAGCELRCHQSNAEHELIDIIHNCRQSNIEMIIINPCAYTHTSIALRDALLAISVPFIEVHLTNIYTREPFRRHSYFSDIAVGTIAGFGAQGYSLALQAAVQYLNDE